MKKATKLIALVLGVLMAVSLLAGCGQKQEPGTTPATDGTGTQTQIETPTGTTKEKVKIQYSNWGTADESKTVIEIAKKFSDSQDKIEVEVLCIPWEQYMTKLNTMATAGELPDTGIMSEAGALQWATQGVLADLSDMYDGTEDKPLDYLAFKYDGKPVAYSVANEILVLYYNKDMFDKAGVPYPPAHADNAWTWEEFIEVAKKLTFDKNGKRPIDDGFDPQNIVQYGAMVENLTWQLEVWTLSNGGGFYSEDGKEVIINKPESIEAIQKVADLYLKEHVAPLSFCIERNIAMKESSFQLIGKPQVTNIRFEVNKDYIFNKEVTLEINSNIRVLRNSREQKKEAIVILSIGIFSSKELPDVPFKLDIEIQGCFAWDGVLDNDTAQLESMLRQNAPAALFSYLRPIVTLITVEANMPPLVLPLMNFIEKE